MASSSLAGAEQIKDLQDLAGFQVLSFTHRTRPWRYLNELFRPMGDDAPVIHTCSSVASLLSLVEQDVGIAFMPEPLVNPAITAGKLVAIDGLPKAPSLNFCCAWRLDDDRILPRLLTDTARKLIKKSQ